MKNLPPELVTEILLYSINREEYSSFLDLPRISRKGNYKTTLHRVVFFQSIIDSTYFKSQIIKIIEYKYGINLNLHIKRKPSFTRKKLRWRKAHIRSESSKLLLFENYGKKTFYHLSSNNIK